MNVGAKRHLVLLQNPSVPVPDGDGGYVQTWSDLNPATWHASIEPATARDLERVAAGTVLASASHIVRGRYRADVTTQTRIVFSGRRLSVTGVANPEEKNEELILTATEVVT